MEKRFGGEIASFARSETSRISQEAAEEIKKRVFRIREENPWLPQDVLVHVRFLLSPYVVVAFVASYTFGNLLSPTFSFLKRLFG
ncbi:MAG: hypothetical protein WA194_04050 [Patescibacteria group bacterium]